ncbi:MAG: hypothetical protein R3B99_29425 [Polyangiales bacterium]
MIAKRRGRALLRLVDEHFALIDFVVNEGLRAFVPGPRQEYSPTVGVPFEETQLERPEPRPDRRGDTKANETRKR